MKKITYNDKVSNGGKTASGLFTANNANEIKKSINDNIDELILNYALKADLVKANAEYIAINSTALPQPSTNNGWTWLLPNRTYTQTNGANIVVSENKVGVANYNGNTWVLGGEIELPSNTAELVEHTAGEYITGDTRTKDGKIFRANKTTSTIPSVGSADWDILGGADDADLRDILRYFLSGAVTEVDQASAEFGYLTTDNAFHPEPQYNKVLRINTVNADILNYDMMPVNTNAPDYAVTIVGVANNDTTTVLMQGQANGTYTVVSGQLDVTAFKQVSVCYNVDRGYTPTFSIPAVGGEVEVNAIKKYVDKLHEYILNNGGQYDGTFYSGKIYTTYGVRVTEGDNLLTSTEKILLYKGDTVEYGVNTAFYDFAQFASVAVFHKNGTFKELILGGNWDYNKFKEDTYTATEDCYIAFSSDDRIQNKGVPYIRITGDTKREKIYTSVKDLEDMHDVLFGLLGETELLNYKLSNESVNGVNSQIGLLMTNNTLKDYTEGDMTNYVYIDVPTTFNGEKADILKITYYRVGGVNSHSNLIGKRADGTLINLVPALQDGGAIVINPNIEVYDISDYVAFSFMLYKYPSQVIVPGVEVFKKTPQMTLGAVKDYVDSKLTDAKPSGKVETETIIQVNRPTAMPTVNILGVLPTDASDERTPTEVEMEFSVDNNIVFKCKSELAIQGNWTVFFAKKGFECVLTNYEDEELKIQFGGWVPCSEFHIKAYPNDQTFARDLTACDLWAQMRRARPFPKSYIADFNSGLTIDKERENLLEQALHYTDGFPVEFRVNGQFYGIYIWRLKKERDNYMINRDNPNHIFLDNEDVVDWTTFDHADWKVRSPRLSGYSDGGVINNPALMDKLNRWWAWFAGISNNSIDFESTVNNYLNVDSWVDWYIAKQLIGHWDSESNNVLLHSWDGVHLSINMYDCDQSFGFSQGAQVSNGIWYRTTFFFNVLYPRLKTRIVARYAELRNQKVIDMNNVYRTFRKTTDHISRDLYNLEMGKWEASNANSGRHNLRYCLNWTMARIAELDTVWTYTPQ